MATRVFRGITYELITGTDDADLLQFPGQATQYYMEGMAGNDHLQAGSAKSVIDGGPGADTMTGSPGGTIFIVDNVNDSVSGLGSHLILSSVTYALPGRVPGLNAGRFNQIELIGTDDIDALGNQDANKLIGNDGSNVLDGDFGADDMLGGLGDDVYIVDNLGDKVTELADEGIDLVETGKSFTASANVENITILFGRNANATGNDLANTLIGNSGINVLSGLAGDDLLVAGIGNDTLNGGADNDEQYGEIGRDALNGDAGNDLLDGGTGADRMAGGAGNDTFYVDNGLDVVIEAPAGGFDTVFTSVALAIPANVEKLVYNGISDGEILTGNALANFLTGNGYVNELRGGAGDDTLDGGPGADEMAGGTGNDTYIVDNSNDAVVEGGGTGAGAPTNLIPSATSAGGIDTVRTFVNFDLPASVESGIVIGKGNVSLGGNSGANKLTGGIGNNTLSGDAGADTLIGGAGRELVPVRRRTRGRQRGPHRRFQSD